MAVSIVLNQAAHPPGVAGVAREDLALGTDVSATAIGGPFLAYQWTIVDKPIDILAGVQSASLLTASSASTTLVTPIDKEGTWVLELLVDSGLGLGAQLSDRARITFYAGPTLAAAPDDLPRRRIGFREQLEHNVPDAIFPLGNPRGWAQEWERWFALIKKLFFGRSHAWARVSLPPGGPAAVVPTGAYNIASVTRVAQGIVDVVFTTNAPNANYAVTHGARGATGGSCCVVSEAVNGFRIWRADPGGALADADFCFDVKARP